MTVQFPQIADAEPRLQGDSYRKNNSDHSFEEQLQAEKARLGLLFSPFSQLSSLFTSADFFIADQAAPDSVQKAPEAKLPAIAQSSYPSGKSADFKLFESIPFARNFSSQMLKELLAQTGWLTPNLAGQPLFFQAFAAGQLLPRFDMQALIDEIVSQAMLVKDRGRTELRLGLKPADLGEILLTLTSHSGLVAIHITARPESKKLIENNLAELKKALNKAAINLDDIKIEEVESNV